MNYSVQSIIEFIKVNNGNPNIIQTGDNLGVILFIIAAVLFSAGVALKIFFKNKQLISANSGNIGFSYAFNKIMPLCLIMISLITLSLGFLSFTNKANADDSQVSADNIKIIYNTDTQQFTCADASLLNNTGKNLILTDVTTELTNADASGLSGTLKLGTDVIYNNDVPGKQLVSTTVVQNNVLTANFTLDPNVASKLEDGQIATISYSMKDSQPVVEPEFYPQPENVTYTGDKFTLSSTINASCDSTIDSSTTTYLKEIFEDKGIEVNFNNYANEEGNYIILSTSNDTSTYPALAQHDGYVLTVDCHGINIIGQDTDAVFLGLTTIGQMLDQSSKELQGLKMSDFAQAEWRGFIEGYYGIPWSNKNRISLMEFGRQFKMNSYIFAPKDDPYHSAEWRTPYPADKLQTMKDLADAGLKYKVDFTWAIHPFMNDPIRFDENYQNDLQCILNKYEQLYQIGVKHFGLSADDIYGQSITAEDQLRLVCDLDSWCKSKGDVKKLVFVPQCYQKGREGQYFDVYWNTMKKAPQSVDLMWTGDDVYAPASQSTFDYFTSVSDHKAYMWWNFPVNDYAKNHLVMGPTYGLIPGVNNFIGLVSNPMQQAQASKVALFSVANYLWNNKNYNADRTWENAFKFVDAGAPESLKLLSKHMCFTKEVWQVDFDESVYMQENLEAATLLLDSDQALSDDLLTKLKNNYNEIKNAIADFKVNHQNAGLYEEILPWLNSFDEQCDASIKALDAISYLSKGDKAQAEKLYKEAQTKFTASKAHVVPVLEGSTEKVFAEAGSKYLVPFVDTMFKYLKKNL